MADQDLWRKNIPADYDGRQGEGWDDEIDAGIVYKIGIVAGVCIVAAFGLCWLLVIGLETTLDEPYVSPVEEANLRYLPPTPLLQAHPERDWDVMLEAMNTRLGFDPEIDEAFAYGWLDEPTGRVHIPVARAMDLVLASAGGTTLGTRQLEPVTPTDLRLGDDDLEDVPNLPALEMTEDTADDSGFAGSVEG